MELLTYLLKSAAVLSLFYMVYHFILRRDTFFTTNRHYLILGVLISALIPMMVFTKTTVVEVQATWTTIDPNNIETVLTDGSNSEQGINWWKIGLILYGIGVLFMSVRFLGQLYSLVRMLVTLPSKRHQGYVHLISDKNVTPFSFFKYIVYNPGLHQQEDLEMIIKHEQAHASQWHSVDILLANIFLIFQWMNPFAWMYKKGIEENLEFIADSEASQRVNSKKEYQLTLVKAVSTSIHPSLTNNFYQSLIRLTLFGKELILGRPFGQVKKRIVMLHKNASKAYHQWKIAVILPILAIFLWSFNVKEVIDYKKIPAAVPTAKTNSTFKEEVDPVDHFIKKDENKSNDVIPAKKEELETIDNEITMSIDKSTTDSELEKIKKIFKDNYDLTINFSEVKRNSNGEITSIKVDVKTKKSNANFHEENDEGIKPFHIYYNDETGSIKIGSSNKHDLHFKGKGENVYVMEIDEDEDGPIKKWVSADGKKIKKGDGYFYIHGDDDGDHKIVRQIKSGDENEKIIIKEANGKVIRIDEDGDGNVFFHGDDEGDHKNVWISKDGNKTVHTDHEVIVIEGDDGSGFFFMDDKGKDSLIFIDGKKSSYKALKKLGKGRIDTIEIIKGEDAIKEYGKKAKDGVIKVTTKK